MQLYGDSKGDVDIIMNYTSRIRIYKQASTVSAHTGSQFIVNLSTVKFSAACRFDIRGARTGPACQRSSEVIGQSVSRHREEPKTKWLRKREAGSRAYCSWHLSLSYFLFVGNAALVANKVEYIA